MRHAQSAVRSPLKPTHQRFVVVAVSTDARSIQVRSTADVLGRVTQVDSSVDGAMWSRQSTFLFDDSFSGASHWPGQLTRSVAYVGATSTTSGTPYVSDVSYDDQFRVVSKKVTVPAVEGLLAGSYVFGSTYDAAGHQTSVSYPAAGGLGAETVSTAFTSWGLPGVLTSSLVGAPSPLAAAPAFDTVGRLIGRTLGPAAGAGRVVTGYGFAGAGQRLSEVTATVGAVAPVAVRDDTYLFDSVGNPLSVRDTVVGQSQCNSFDTRNRLSSAFTSSVVSCGVGTADGFGPVPFRESYVYDAATNNMTSITRGLTSPVTTTQTYAAAGHAHAVSATGGGSVASFTYNADGSLASRTGVGAGSYAWDGLGRLVTATSGGVATSMVYGADGSRLLRKDAASTTLFLDGMELKLTGATVTGTRFYAHAGTTVGMRTSVGGLVWVLGDTQASFSLTVDAGTGVVARQRYTPYGAVRGSGSTLGTDRGWLGKTADAGSGLNYLGARFYDSGLAHFLSPDPLLDTGNPKSYAAYSYAGDNPIGFTEPTGLMVQQEKGGGCSTTCNDGTLSLRRPTMSR